MRIEERVAMSKRIPPCCPFCFGPVSSSARGYMACQRCGADSPMASTMSECSHRWWAPSLALARLQCNAGLDIEGKPWETVRVCLDALEGQGQRVDVMTLLLDADDATLTSVMKLLERVWEAKRERVEPFLDPDATADLGTYTTLTSPDGRQQAIRLPAEDRVRKS